MTRCRRDALRVITRAGSHHAARAVGFGEARNPVRRAANFEREHILKIFALQPDFAAQRSGELRRKLRRRALRKAVDLRCVNAGAETKPSIASRLARNSALSGLIFDTSFGKRLGPIMIILRQTMS